MTTKQRYAAATGLVLALAWVPGIERAAAVQGGGQQAAADMCTLLTQEEAAAILGSPVGAPQKGSGGMCRYAKQSGMGDDIMIQNVPLTFGSEDEFHAYLVKTRRG